MADVDFVILLALSDYGRENLDEAVSTLGGLQGPSSIAIGVEGTIDKWTLTHGHYDAVVMGHCPDVESVSSLVGWIQSKKYFVSHTLIGASADAFSYKGRAYQHS